jgi:hypothetical protein
LRFLAVAARALCAVATVGKRKQQPPRLAGRELSSAQANHTQNMIHAMYPRAGRFARLSALAVLAALGTCASALAQIGSGYTWTPYTDSNVHIQWQTNGSYSKHPLKQDRTASDGVYDWNGTDTEKFILKGSNVNRIEYRGRDYTSGVYQFQGWLRVSDSATSSVAVAQCFHTALLKWYSDSGGRLRYHSASDFDGTSAELRKDIKTNGRGVWIKVNIVHDASTNRITVYIDNTKVIDNHPAGDTGTFYFKYGAYDASGSDDETIEWKNVQIFKRS